MTRFCIICLNDNCNCRISTGIGSCGTVLIMAPTKDAHFHHLSLILIQSTTRTKVDLLGGTTTKKKLPITTTNKNHLTLVSDVTVVLNLLLPTTEQTRSCLRMRTSHSTTPKQTLRRRCRGSASRKGLSRETCSLTSYRPTTISSRMSTRRSTPSLPIGATFRTSQQQVGTDQQQAE